MNTVSLELSKQLSEVAKKKWYKLPDSRFFWTTNNIKNKKWYLEEESDWYEHGAPRVQSSAFTADEILDIFPSYLEMKGATYGFQLGKRWANNGYYAAYMNGDGDPISRIVDLTDKSPANALCKLWIYLIDNDLI